MVLVQGDDVVKRIAPAAAHLAFRNSAEDQSIWLFIYMPVMR